ncbi:hypothetical protein B0T10DRAFT_600861 [Thelonectria olida]|uniref:F-box domain-containing protein n=1 Tax=Thelonectria olida TaxID=1576542 RepID=A0A9P9AXV5_9HYPO|nr:hypothetical protein B0T10DRAFT_600861 [Thelonectria olida]
MSGQDPRCRYCTLCGVVCRSRHMVGFDPDARLDWSGEVRAVKSRQGRENPALTGLGFFTNCIRASRNPDETYLDNRNHLINFDLLNMSKSYWTFMFHEECWQLLLAKIRSQPGQETQSAARIAAKLFDVLYCLPWERVVAPAHDFGGAAYFGSLLSRAQSWGFLMAEPSREFAYLPDRGAVNPFWGCPPPLPSTNPTDECFSTLPREINGLILEFMASRDICNLRLASRTMMILAHPNNLPQTFWASRFGPQNEMGFFACGHPHLEKTNWRSLYVDLKQALADTTRGGQLRNRRRIWRVLDAVTRCMIPLLQQPDTATNQPMDLTLAPYDTYSLGKRMQTYIRAGNLDASEEGDAFNTETIIFFPENSNMTTCHLAVSFLTFNCTTFICGFRVLVTNGESELSRAGLILPATETKLPLDLLISISVQVVSSTAGVVGLHVFPDAQFTQLSSLGAAILGSFPADTGIATLRPRQGSRTAGLVIGTDACKVISIQLVESQDLSALTPAKPSIDRNEKLTVPLWQPFPPSMPNVILLPALATSREQKHSSMCLNMNFGGPDGCWLPLLTRVVARYGFSDHYMYIQSLSFVYTGFGDTWRYTYGLRYRGSRRHNSVADQFIDGPGGERIVEIRLNQPSGWLTCLEMRTNRGRVMDLSTSSPNNAPMDHFRFPYMQVIEIPRDCQMTSFLAEA